MFSSRRDFGSAISILAPLSPEQQRGKEIISSVLVRTVAVRLCASWSFTASLEQPNSNAMKYFILKVRKAWANRIINFNRAPKHLYLF